MKKRITAILLALSVLTTIPAGTVYAEESPFEPLYRLADSLGNKTDHFNFVNYFSSVKVLDENRSDYIEFKKNMNNADAVLIDHNEKYLEYINNVHCEGWSLLTTLVHNGLIAPGDLHDGAEKLIEIMKDDVDDKVTYYQASQEYTDSFGMYMNWCLNHFTFEENVDMLLENAERSMEQNKYFLINFKTNLVSHAIVGIGIADGEWEFEGEKYDKCVLTIDCDMGTVVDTKYNHIDAKGFVEEAAIYVNSKTKKVFMPIYHADGRDKNLMIASCTDDKLMNFKGCIAPSESYDTDTSKIERIYIDNGKKFGFIATEADGTTNSGIAEGNKAWYDEKGRYVYFCNAEEYNITNPEKEKFINSQFANIRNGFTINAEGSVNNIRKTADSISMTSDGATNYDIGIYLNEGYYGFTPHYSCKLSGVSDKGISAEVAEKGIILRSGGAINCTVETNDVVRDDNGKLQDAFANTMQDGICSAGSVMISYDENGKLNYYIGENFDKKVEKGDVDCDGKITAYDASLILTAYTDAAAKKRAFVGNILGDQDGDDKITAYDASLVLTKYTELSS